jgi:YD repeat-containing protein
MFASKDLFLTAGAPSGYKVSRSALFSRFTGSHATRTPSVAGDRQKWTWSGWIKPGKQADGGGSANGCFFSNAGGGGAGRFWASAKSSSVSIREFDVGGGIAQLTYDSAAYLMGDNGWFHIVIIYDTTQTTSTDRLKVYINNNLIANAAGTPVYPTLNYNGGVNSVGTAYVGAYSSSPTTDSLNGLITEINFIDGQTLTPSSFGQTDATTGVWLPIRYTGTYGTNGYYLNFSDNSNTTSTTFGKDYSGNGNNFIPTGVSVTGTSVYCNSFLDTPTEYYDGVNEHGPYATFNSVSPILGTNIISGGLLALTPSSTGTSYTLYGTPNITLSSYYWELTNNTAATTSTVGVSDRTNTSLGSVTLPAGSTYGFRYTTSSRLIEYTTNGSSWTTLYTAPATVTYITFYATQVSSASTTTGIFLNCGQRTYTYTKPTGYKTISAYNTPDQTTFNPRLFFTTTVYTGTAAIQTVNNSISNIPATTGFQPDETWVVLNGNKAEINNINYATINAHNNLNTTALVSTTSSYISSFNSNGFTLTSNALLNNISSSYRAVQWKASNTYVTDTSGSIGSVLLNANATCGFSLVKYTGNGTAGATVPHGLGVAPEIIFVKDSASSGASDWAIYSKAVGNTVAYILDSTGTNCGQQTNVAYWNNTTPGASFFTLGTGGAGFNTNISGTPYVARCWTSIAGFSEVGSTYIGNNSGSSPFIPTSFTPKVIIIKHTTSTTAGWAYVDTASTPPVSGTTSAYWLLNSNGSFAINSIAICSNGFQILSNNVVNNGSATYLFMAFADTSSKYSQR